MQPVQEHTIRLVRVNTTFDRHINDLQLAFASAKAQALSDLKDESNFVPIVIKCMQAVGATSVGAGLHSFERDEFISDLVKDVVNSMPLSDEVKTQLRVHAFPTIDCLVTTLFAASKGYLLFKYNDAKKPVAPKKRSARDGEAPAEVPVVPPIDVNALVQDVYSTLETMLRVKQVSLASIISIVSLVMQIIQQYPQLPGIQKKLVALAVLHRVVDNANLSDNDKAIINLAIDTTASQAIDFIIRAANGQVEFVNNAVEQVTGCIANCRAKKPAQ